MTVAELIEKLMECPLDADVSILWTHYNGGEDEREYGKPDIHCMEYTYANEEYCSVILYSEDDYYGTKAVKE